MALSIVADTSSPIDSMQGITKSSRWSCDAYSGTGEALIGAGLITKEQLAPQKGRAAGYTAFLPNGDPCPVHLRTWREPGFKAIRQQDDGAYCVEITVSKAEQLQRRQAEKAARHEAEQARINDEIAKCGSEYRNWRFRQDFGGSTETWEGTKAQLQAAGLGIGLKFPGEPGAPQELHCQCPLGFQFRIRLPEYSAIKAAAGIYIAHSSYLPRGEAVKQYETYAPGVLREVWSAESWSSSNYFHGTADALVASGIVPDLRLFPGQPGAPKLQASYRKDWHPMPCGSGRMWGATIRKRGKCGQYIVEVPATQAEDECRKKERQASEEQRRLQEQSLSAERKKLRQGAQPEKTDDEFRTSRAEWLELSLRMLWREVFAKADGALKFDIPEDGEIWESLAEAFQTIRDAVEEADIERDNKGRAATQTHLRLVAARNDKELQRLLHDAPRLRLVRPAVDDERG